MGLLDQILGGIAGGARGIVENRARDAEAEKAKLAEAETAARMSSMGWVPESAAPAPVPVMVPGATVDVPRHTPSGVEGWVIDQTRTPEARARNEHAREMEAARAKHANELAVQAAKQAAEREEWDRQWEARTQHERAMEATRQSGRLAAARVSASTRQRERDEPHDPYSPKGLQDQLAATRTQAGLVGQAADDIATTRGTGWRERVGPLQQRQQELIARGDSLTRAIGGDEAILRALRGARPENAPSGGRSPDASVFAEANERYAAARRQILTSNLPEAAKAQALAELQQAHEAQIRALTGAR